MKIIKNVCIIEDNTMKIGEVLVSKDLYNLLEGDSIIVQSSLNSMGLGLRVIGCIDKERENSVIMNCTRVNFGNKGIIKTMKNDYDFENIIKRKDVKVLSEGEDKDDYGLKLYKLLEPYIKDEDDIYIEIIVHSQCECSSYGLFYRDNRYKIDINLGIKDMLSENYIKPVNELIRDINYIRENKPNFKETIIKQK